MKLPDDVQQKLISDLIYRSLTTGQEFPDFYCDCDTRLPKDEWTLSHEDNAAVARINCPNCGEPHEVSIS